MNLPENPLSDDLSRICDANAELWGELRGARLFLTGGTGFFGCWMLEALAAFNDKLGLQIDATILTRDADRFRRKAPHLAGNSAFHFVTGDVCEFELSGQKFDHVIHAATEASAELTENNPRQMISTIVGGTTRCLRFAAECGAKNFLLTSSGAIYGPQPPMLAHLSEDYTGGPDPLDRRNVYAEGKRVAEAECALAGAPGDLKIKIARCFAFVGPYLPLDAHFAIGNFIRDQLVGGPIRVRGDGTPVRSYMYAGDLVIWLFTILLRGRHLRAYNVGSEQAVTIAETARLVASSLAPAVEVEIEGNLNRAGAANVYVPSTQRAQHELGLRCEVALRDAIRKTHAWYRTQGAYAESR
jgi:dTDP-glucose 4,6-dehydratase